VIDGQGTPISGASILLTGDEQFPTLSDEDGCYVLDGLTRGNYSIKVSYDDYKFRTSVKSIRIPYKDGYVNFEANEPKDSSPSPSGPGPCDCSRVSSTIPPSLLSDDTPSPQDFPGLSWSIIIVAVIIMGGIIVLVILGFLAQVFGSRKPVSTSPQLGIFCPTCGSRETEFLSSSGYGTNWKCLNCKKTFFIPAQK
jgi:hypothetical protein